jgi:hypothetical protein
MTAMKKFLIAGLLGACALVCFSLFKRGAEPNTASSAHVEDHSNNPPAKRRDDNLAQPDERDMQKGQTAATELPTAYQALARSTSLPEQSVDPTGRTLPKEFAVYLKNENAGYDKFVAGLSPDGVAAFTQLKQSVSALGATRFTEFVAKNTASEKPSSFDFVLYTTLRELVHEYPAINDAAKADITRHWTSLAQSSNPIFRLLAINEAHRVIKNKAVALALLDTRTSEVDPVIAQALIDQLVTIGGDAAKAALTRVADNAHERHDQAVSKAADEAKAKLQ